MGNWRNTLGRTLDSRFFLFFSLHRPFRGFLVLQPSGIGGPNKEERGATTDWTFLPSSYFSSFPSSFAVVRPWVTNRTEITLPWKREEKKKKATPRRAAYTQPSNDLHRQRLGPQTTYIPTYILGQPHIYLYTYICYIGSVWHGNGQFVWRMCPASSATLFFRRGLCACSSSNMSVDHREQQMGGWKNCLSCLGIFFYCRIVQELVVHAGEWLLL